MLYPKMADWFTNSIYVIKYSTVQEISLFFLLCLFLGHFSMQRLKTQLNEILYNRFFGCFFCKFVQNKEHWRIKLSIITVHKPFRWNTSQSFLYYMEVHKAYTFVIFLPELLFVQLKHHKSHEILSNNTLKT